MSRLSPPPRSAVVRGPSGGAPPAARRFLISGQLHRPLALTVADLRARWPQRHAPVVFDCATNGPQRHTFDGPLLRDVLDAAGPAFDARRRKDRSRFLLTVAGGDGHHTVLSWAEIDADFGNAPILLATAMDGRPLDAMGSQLVVPSDRCGARYISAITGIWVGACPAPGER
ncbi:MULTISPECIES: molybdopterin-dependent oxidoreductase [unclassified Streptomyces]|uniref:molybdopterin-dependent oxidoreductase n=1 Tax=unclassified Streptomyces TaxID=2593676 RepID=UPI0003662828|nr:MULTISPECIES: molybdopterin-dependent oxidoreductase [unclassified Streptomyces]MYT33984.1 molybdopterin-dependent oxidoreductase [Streptomyces sp. SID8354]